MTERWVLSRDEIETFLPKTPARLVILGTMASIRARSLDGVRPQSSFYYHDGRNRFWQVLSLLYGVETPKNLEEKQALLDSQGIAMANLVDSVEIPRTDASNASDEILFSAQTEGRLTFKRAPEALKVALERASVVFTCRRKAGIERLLSGYCEENGLELSLSCVRFLPSPTRRSAREIAEAWREEMGIWRVE